MRAVINGNFTTNWSGWSSWDVPIAQVWLSVVMPGYNPATATPANPNETRPARRIVANDGNTRFWLWGKTRLAEFK
jgi:hypothetical protein